MRRMRPFWIVLVLCASAAAQPAFDPIGPDGWPRGLTLEDLRALPECGVEGLPHTPGAPVTCRPPLVEHTVQWAFGLDWTSGAMFGTATNGAAHALGVQLDFMLPLDLQLGARYELTGVGLAAMPTSALDQHFLGMLAHRWFTDEVGRDAWTLGVGGGFALRGDELGGSAPLVRAALARSSGVYIDDDNALTTTLELAYERSLGAMPLSAVLASVRLGFETHIREPRNLGQPEPAPWFRHSYGFGWMLGSTMGFDASLGIPLGRHWSVQTSGEYAFGSTFNAGLKLDGLDHATWSLAAGPRLSLDWFYVQAQAGGAWVAQASQGELRPFGQAELGVRAIACHAGVELGLWLRGTAPDGVTDGGFVLRAIFGAGRGALGEDVSCHHDRALALESPPPEPAPVSASPPTVTLAPPPPPSPSTLSVTLPPVPVPPPQPITLDVDLGVSIPGFQLRIDPRILPLDRLRGAGFVQIELSGPPSALPQFQAELSATLSRNSIRADAWSTVATDATTIHARFTIWPPGTRP